MIRKGQRMTTKLDQFLQNQEHRRLYEQERLILEITEEICALMNEKDVSRAELAQRLGCSPSNVSQILDGDNNFTVRTIADCLLALGARLSIASERLCESNPNVALDLPDFTYQPEVSMQYSSHSQWVTSEIVPRCHGLAA